MNKSEERRKQERRRQERRKQDREKRMAEMEQLSIEAIKTIAHTIDAKDSYTNGHSVRVANYSVEIARKMGWRGKQLNDLRSMALLHDIGKIGIPDRILNKPALLTDAEYSVIQTHTRIGADILKGIHSIENLADGARYHHERYDGRGYMDGLQGEEIPITARIIGIADAFDAMTSHRTYQKNLSDEYGVIAEIKKGRGTQFDPQITDIMLECLEEGIFDEILRQEDEKERERQKTGQLAKNVGWSDESVQQTDFFRRFCSAAFLEQKVNEHLKRDDYTNLIVIELQNYHKINQESGHRAGDAYIFEMMKIIYGRLHEGELACRIRDNQFVIGIDYYEDTWERYEDLHKETIEKEIPIVCAFVKAGISDKEFSTLYKHAEQALYHAKMAGLQYFVYQSDPYHLIPQEQIVRTDIARIKEHLYKNRSRIDADDGCLVLFTISTVGSSDYMMDSMDAVLQTLQKTTEKIVPSDSICIRYSTNQLLLQLQSVQMEQIKMWLDETVSAYMKVTQYEAFELSYQVVL